MNLQYPACEGRQNIPKARQKQGQVLVVDDDEAGRYTLVHCLRNAGYTVEQAETGEECLRLMDKGNIDLVILDVKLPGISGIEVCKRIKNDPGTVLIPVIQKSALLTSSDDRIEGIESGADAYLASPFDPRELLAHVEGLLRVRRAEQQRMQDIEARLKTERALRESQNFLALGMEVAQTGAWQYDLNTEETTWGYGMAELLGVPGSKALRESNRWSDFIHPEDREEVLASFFAAANDRAPRWDAEFRVIRTDGTTRWLASRGGVVPFGPEGHKMIGVVMDITDRKGAEGALRESEARFRTLADGTPVPIWVHGEDGGLRFVNRAWQEFFGVSLQDVLGGNWQPLVHPEDHGYVETFLTCHAERREFGAQCRVRRHDGQWRWMQSIGVPRFSPDGEYYLGMAGSSVDITERKEAEAVLKRSNEDLERLVTERTARLQELVAELEHFSYSITHDMRAPLRAMMGFATAIEELCGDDQEIHGFLKRIQTSAKRMDLLITDALNYSRAVRNELPLAPVDVGVLLRGMLDTYPELQSAQSDILLEGRIPLVMGNEAGLTQCFSNLLVNAVKFAQPGKRANVKVWSEMRNDWVRIWVEDKGIGISSRMLPRVFDMFERGSSSQAGTGIGLALVRKVVERMGGKVGVDSEEGKGSQFWVELDAAEHRWTDTTLKRG